MYKIFINSNYKRAILFRSIVTTFFIVTLLWLFSACKTVENFLSQTGPRYYGEHAVDNLIETDKALKVVSFNIEYGMKIEEAIGEIESSDNLKGADIILLQEMDAEGSEMMATELEYNYVYYPSNRNSDNKLFGLAILTKWDIISDQKIILPYETPVNDRRRMAVMADIQIGNDLVCVYNVHTATQSMGRSKRQEQYRFILDHLEEHQIKHPENKVILGGDFNTFLKKDREYLIELCEKENLQCVSGNIGATWQKFEFLNDLALDHFFSRGFSLIDSGKLPSTEASDHLPIWVNLKMN